MDSVEILHRTREGRHHEIGQSFHHAGQSTTQRLQDITTFTVHLADALNVFADRVMPRAAQLKAENYAPAVELVKRRLNIQP